MLHLNTYTFHITLYDLAFLGAIFTGLTIALFLWFTPRINRAANRLLALALALAVLRMAWLLGIDIKLSAYYPHWARLPLQFSLAMGPLIYFYVLKITRPEYKFGWKDLQHFSPVLLEQVVLVLAVNESISTGAATYDTSVFRLLSPIVQLLAFISVIIYLYMAHRQIGRFYGSIKFNGGDRYRHHLRWLHGLLAAFGGLWLLWIPCAATGYFGYHNQQGQHIYYLLYLLLAAMITWIGAMAFLRPDGERLLETSPVSKSSASSASRQKGIWLKRAMEANRYFEDPDINLSSLAEKLVMQPHELSRIINNVLKKNFNDFINEYRVREVTRKMQDPAYDHITLLGIAYGSGFNSQTTFNRIFKQITGKSPVEYKNELKKEQPTYNVGSITQVATVISHSETATKWYHYKLTRNYMFKNYFKIARRNLMRNKSYAAINITGLAVGIAVCMVIFIIIQYQTSFDNFHAEKDRIYRVLTEYHHADAGNISYGKDLSFPMPVGLKTGFPQIEQVAPIFASHDDQLLIPDNNGPVKEFKEQRGVFFTGPSFFKIFDFPLLAGSYASLKDPNNVLLTKEIAEKYFGDWKTAIGKTIKLRAGGYIFEHGTDVLKVSGILATIPANTDFQLKLVVAFGTGFTGSYLQKSTDWDVTVADFGCYILLPPNTTAANFNQQLLAYSRKVESPANKDSHIVQSLNAVHYDAEAGNYSNKTISHQLLNVLWLSAPVTPCIPRWCSD